MLSPAPCGASSARTDEGSGNPRRTEHTQYRRNFFFPIVLYSENTRTKPGVLFSPIVNPSFIFIFFFPALKPILHAAGRKRYNAR